MNIDKNTEFGSLEILMLEITDHIKDGADPKTNSQHYNIVWQRIYDYIQTFYDIKK